MITMSDGEYVFEDGDYEYKSPEPKVVARYTLSRVQPDRFDEAVPALKRIISNCLAAQIKRDDAPCSSETHLNTAIALLAELLPDYAPNDEDMKDALRWAIAEGKILRGEQ